MPGEREPTEQELSTALWMYGLRSQAIDDVGVEDISSATIAMVAGQMESAELSDCGFKQLETALTAALDHPQVREKIFSETKPFADKIRDNIADD